MRSLRSANASVARQLKLVSVAMPALKKLEL